MKMSETIDFILKNRNSLNPAVLRTVLGSIESDEEESTEPTEPTTPTEPTEPTTPTEPTEQIPQ